MRNLAQKKSTNTKLVFIQNRMKFACKALGTLLLGITGSCSNIIEPYDKAISREEEPKYDSQYLRTEKEASNCVAAFISDEPDLRSGISTSRKVVSVIDISKTEGLRADPYVSELSDRFYIVTLSEKQGYAVVSKDRRCFPVYAVLDSGEFSTEDLYEPAMRMRFEDMIEASKVEMLGYEQWISNTFHTELRHNNTDPHQRRMGRILQRLLPVCPKHWQ